MGLAQPGDFYGPPATRLTGALSADAPPARRRRGVHRPDITPDMEQPMAYRDPAVRLQRDRERFHRRTAERLAAGLCAKCGKQPPAPDRTVCDPCAAKRNKASRARDARLRAEGKPRRDPARARSSERRRYRRQADARCEAGRCTRCGQAPAVPERSMCEGCAAKCRASDRARYEAGKEAGLTYGGADADVKRRAARAASKRRQQARHAAGLCIRCGKRPPVQGGTTCGPCREARQAAERQQYAERRAGGLCTRCGGPALRRSVALRPLRRDRRRQPVA